jgi:hypothetical protein
MKSEKLENLVIALIAMGSVAVTGALALSFAWLVMGLAMQLLEPAAFAQTKPAVELESAIAREQVDGDLKTAIPANRKIAADTSASRDARQAAAAPGRLLCQEIQTRFMQSPDRIPLCRRHYRGILVTHSGGAR